MQQRSRREEYSEATRAALVDAARANFAKLGYAATPIETVAREARVTRGALYHHFEDKRALFEAVVRQVQGDVALQVRDAARREVDLWASAGAGLAAFLAASHTPEYRRIVLEDAVSVLGWHRWREIDAEYMLGDFITALTGLIAAGVLRPVPVDMLAHLLTGAIAEAAFMVASSDTPEQAAEEARHLLLGFLTSLRP
jgi:AcrR family transcriptional regulator